MLSVNSKTGTTCCPERMGSPNRLKGGKVPGQKPPEGWSQDSGFLSHCPIHYTGLPFNIYAPKYSTFKKNAVHLINYQSAG